MLPEALFLSLAPSRERVLARVSGRACNAITIRVEPSELDEQRAAKTAVGSARHDSSVISFLFLAGVGQFTSNHSLTSSSPCASRCRILRSNSRS